MKKIVLFSILIVGFLNLKSQNINVSGNINVNTIWAAASIDTVKITGNTTIDSLVTLTIEPGIVIDFTNSYYFNVKGRLIAIGTSSDSITFTTSDTTGFYNNTHHGWSGIRIHDRKYTSDTISVEYCIVEYGKADGSSGLPYATHGGGLYTYSNYMMKVSNSTFRNNWAAGNGGAIYDSQSFTNTGEYYDMNECMFVNNESQGNGGAIYTTKSTLNINRCVFERNRAVNGDGGAIKDAVSSHIKIKRSRFSYNEAKSGGALNLTNSTANHLLKQSFLNNNYASNGNGGAVNLFQTTIDCQNNVFVNNEASMDGGAIYSRDVFSDGGSNVSAMANNTIAYNQAVRGGGVFVYDNFGSGGQYTAPNLYFNKTIFYNNESTDPTFNEDVGLLDQGNTNHTRFYSCSFTNDLNNTGESSLGTLVIQYYLFNNNPNFKTPSSGVGKLYEGYVGKDWTLGCGSTCIDADGIGVFTPDSLDYNGGPREISEAIDMGAFESPGITVHPQNMTVCEGDAAVFNSAYYYSGVLTNSWVQFSPDKGINWYADTYSDAYVISNNISLSNDSLLFYVEHDFGCGQVYSDTAVLTVLPRATTQNTVSACGSYFVGGANQTVSAIYYDTLQTIYGCDSIIETDLTITTVDTSITQTGTDLTANELVATYQWLDCNNNYAVISGATYGTYYGITNGSYAVEVTYYGCIDTSSCYTIVVTGVVENTMITNEATIYPNPSYDGIFTLEWAGENKYENVSVVNILGAEVYNSSLKDAYAKYDLNLSGLTKGVYYVTLFNEDIKTTSKVMIMK